MDLDSYQSEARKTAQYPYRYRVIYPGLKLAGEAGEVAQKIGKVLRGDHDMDLHDLLSNPHWRHTMSQELGDVLWYVAALATDLGLSLGLIARDNLAKLASRASRGVVRGDGDQR